MCGGLKELGREDIIVIAGGVIPPKDYQYLYDAGVKGVFGPGTVIAIAAQKILIELMPDLADFAKKWRNKSNLV